MIKWLWCLALSLMLVSVQAEAKRLGGGASMGRQSANVTQRQAAPVAPAQGVTNNAAARPATPAPATAAPKRAWGGILGGLAAGLGLAWLAHSLGLGAEMGQFLMLLLVGVAVMVAISWFTRARRSPAAAPGSSPYAFEGAGGATPAMPRSYRPENVGNDASARPWEQTGLSSEGVGTQGSMIGSALGGTQSWGIPAGFDTAGFLASAKANFVSLQAAWDKSDMTTLRVMMTDTMLKEIQSQLAEREAHVGGPVNLTEVVMIEASLLGIEDLGEDYLASVEFSGMIREEPSAGPAPFREVWNMIKPKNGRNGWLVAGVQALQ